MKKANTTIRLVTPDGLTVYPHDTHLAGPDGLNYRLDSWDADGTLYVYEWPGPGRRVCRNARDFKLSIVSTHGAAQVTPAQMEQAFDIVKRPEYWCRAKLFHALRAAQVKGVLHEVLEEMEVDGREEARIINHLNQYWKE